MTNIKVATVYSGVNKAYILDSLNYQYRGKNYKFSDDLLTILESDFKRKAKNLDWLFQGQTRISVKPSAESLFNSISDNIHVMDFVTIARIFGYGIDAENFVAGYVIIDKQQVRLHKARELIRSKTPPILSGDIADRLVSTRIRAVKNKYRPEAHLNTNNRITPVNDLIINTDGLVVSVHNKNVVNSSWRSGVFDTDHISSLLNSSEVIMSIDINDYITCSEGGISSCMSMNSSSTRHLGWMMHYRSDFSVITFTHKKGDPFYKTGRTWTYLKLTEDGLPFARPFYKLSRVYGELNDGHVRAVDAYVQEHIREHLQLGEPKKHTDHKAVSYGSFKSIVSPNMQNAGGNYNGTGYFDWPQDSTAVWSRLPLWEYEGTFPVVPFTSENYEKGPVCLYNFPDALDVDGNATTQSLFTNEPKHTTNTLIGWNERYKQFVTCSVTGAKTLLRDTIEVSKGVYMHKEQAAIILSGKTIEPVVVEEVVAQEVKVVEVSDEEILDF